MTCFLFLLLANGFTVFLPGRFSASSFLTAYIGIPIFLGIYLVHRFTVGKNERWLHPPHEVDLTTDLSEVEADAEMWANLEAAEKEQQGNTHAWLRRVSILWE